MNADHRFLRALALGAAAMALLAGPSAVALVLATNVLALDGDRCDLIGLDRLDEAGEADFGVPRLLLRQDRPEDQPEQQQEEPQAEISRYWGQWCLCHGVSRRRYHTVF